MLDLFTEHMRGKFEMVTYYETTYQTIESLMHTHLKLKNYRLAEGEDQPPIIVHAHKGGAYEVWGQKWVLNFLKGKDREPPLDYLFYELQRRGVLESGHYLIIGNKKGGSNGIS